MANDQEILTATIPADTIAAADLFEDMRKQAYADRDPDTFTSLAQAALMEGDSGKPPVSLYDRAIDQALSDHGHGEVDTSGEKPTNHLESLGSQIKYVVEIDNASGLVQDIRRVSDLAPDSAAIARQRSMARQVPWGRNHNIEFHHTPSASSRKRR